MNNQSTLRLLVLAAAAAMSAGCAPKDAAKPDPKASASEPATTTTAANTNTDATQQPAPAGKPEMKGLDPTPPLSRTDMGNGLVIEDLKMGTGDVVWPGGKARLTIHGWSVATGKMYWDTPNQGGPKDIALATAMKGMKDGIPGMRVGGKRRLHIPGDKAYGFKEIKNEKGEVIVPQLSPIVLEIEVVEVLSKLKTDTPAGAAPAGAAADQPTGTTATAPK